MEITERLRNTPTGFVIQVGTNRVQVKRFEAIYQGKAVVCRGCLFRGDGARDCEYSKACMAHLRPDHESVVLAKTNKV